MASIKTRLLKILFSKKPCVFELDHFYFSPMISEVQRLTILRATVYDTCLRPQTPRVLFCISNGTVRIPAWMGCLLSWSMSLRSSLHLNFFVVASSTDPPWSTIMTDLSDAMK